MAAYHDRIRELTKVLRKATALAVANPDNALCQQVYKVIVAQYKSALKNEPPI